ncbi:DUF3617 family protein [Novosphingobium sp.]|uniref:DUF3617 domain-containing protein n=1 Tax=Novosphingobium sp. TaxID=1874826 RepID=UPI00286C3CDF|nr:DUF3617 family protein [Novosphingobium sp.]
MSLRHTVCAIAITVALISSPAALNAQTTAKDTAKRDVNTWAETMGESFSPGKWEGTMQTTEEGEAQPPKPSTDCFKPGGLNPMFAELRDVFLMVIDNTECTTQSGGKGSLDLVLDCRRDDGGHIRFASSGARTADSVQWAVDVTSDGPGAFGTSRMQITSRKVADQC